MTTKNKIEDAKFTFELISIGMKIEVRRQNQTAMKTVKKRKQKQKAKIKNVEEKHRSCEAIKIIKKIDVSLINNNNTRVT